jgi:hypothetical protein
VAGYTPEPEAAKAGLSETGTLGEGRRAALPLARSQWVTVTLHAWGGEFPVGLSTSRDQGPHRPAQLL